MLFCSWAWRADISRFHRITTQTFSAVLRRRLTGIEIIYFQVSSSLTVCGGRTMRNFTFYLLLFALNEKMMIYRSRWILKLEMPVRWNRQIRSIEAHNKRLLVCCTLFLGQSTEPEHWTRLCKLIFCFRWHKIIWYLTVIRRDYSTIFAAADRSFAFCATLTGRWKKGKSFTVLNPRSFVEISQIMAAKTLKNLYRSQIMTFKISQKGKKRATESLVFRGFDNSISRGWEQKSTGGRFATGRFWPCNWQRKSYSLWILWI